MSFHKNIKLLTWFNFFTDFKLYAPIAIIYFSRVSHSYALGASVFSITYVISALFDIPTGLFADVMGRKKTVVLGALFAVLCAVFYAIGLNFWILAVGACFEGLSRAFYSGNNEALLHNMLSEEEIADEFHMYSGKLDAMFQAALAVSSLLGGFIAFWSFPLLMWLSVVPQILCLFICLNITDVKRKQSEGDSLIILLKEALISFVHVPNLRLLSFYSIISFGIGETGYQFQAAFYNLLLPIWAVGIIKTLSNIGATASYFFSGKLINKFKALNVLFMGALYNRIVSIFALAVPTLFSPLLMASTSLFHGSNSTATTTLLQREFTDKQRATMSSLNSFGGSLFFALIAFLTGIFVDKVGPTKTLLVLQILSLPTLWLLWKLYRLPKKHNE